MKDRKAVVRCRSRSAVRLSDLALLVRAPAALSVPGDVIAGAVAAGRPLGARTFGVIGSSVCLYWAGMALNDYADAAVDGVERPDRPVPSGRVPRRAALAVAGGLTAVGLGLAAVAGGRRSVCAALPLAGLVWAYDLKLKSTGAGGAAMAGARMLDVLAGAVVPGAGAASVGTALRRAAVPAVVVGAHTGTLMALSRHEIGGAPVRVPVRTLGVSVATVLGVVGPVVLGGFGGAGTGRVSSAAPSGLVAQFPAPLKGVAGTARFRELCAAAPEGLRVAASERLGASASAGMRASVSEGMRGSASAGIRASASAGMRTSLSAGIRASASEGLRVASSGKFRAAVTTGAALAYLGAYGTAQIRAVREPSADNVQRAVGAGILGLMPLQAALIARGGAPRAAAALGIVHPLARRLARRISPT
ncbi:UbiA family prenyltransferase [Streptomyces sp. bgisy027]|uniref:UbiA family prenyltransferase n=1 Tax=Streptomyces sp. bgisy027 TaxID=3413770 RepID=UPI003D71857A